MFILILRVACFLIWASVAAVLAPSVRRYFFGPVLASDACRVGYFFVALLVMGSMGRWLFLAYDTAVVPAMYSLTAALGIFVLILTTSSHRND